MALARPSISSAPMRLPLALGLLAFSIPLAAPAAAQADTTAARVAPRALGCTYETCALRIEPGLLGTAVVRGRQGERVSGISLFGNTLEAAVASSPAALAHARRATRGQRLSGLLMIGSLVALNAAFFALSNGDVDLLPQSNVLLYSALGLSLASGAVGLGAQREVARAVWEYNATLAR